MSAMDEIRQTFFEECTEQLAEVEAGLLAMSNSEADSDTINAVFRAVHSIKGGAGAFNFTELVQFSHVFETSLDAVRSNRLAPSPDVARVMLRAADLLADLVNAANAGESVDADRRAALSADLSALLGPKPEAAAPSGDASRDDGMDGLDFTPITISADELFGTDQPARFTVTFRPLPALYAKANEATRLIRECLSLGSGSVTCEADAVPSLDELDPEGAFLTFTIDLTTASGEIGIREIFEFVEGDCELTVSEVIEAGDFGGIDDPELAALLARMQAESADSSSDAGADDFAGFAAVTVAEEAETAPFAAAPAEPAAPAAPVAQQREPEVKQSSGAAAPVPSASIRVDLERVDRLIDLVGELVIHQVMLSQRAIQAGLTASSELAVGFDELEQLTREIQDSVMAIRAQAVKSVFQKLPRLVREVAGITGKNVALVTEGEYTEVDKTVIERLSDPLTHMIRNAIDHGIETPDKRAAAGKSVEGTIRVAAMHRSGRIVIEVSDDGAGINRPVVRNIAVNKGLIPATAILTDDEIDNLIFLPGFSTKEEVSELSGRGVGMDVVKRSIQALGGRVSISSQPGKGSMFTMSLPLTLAVLDGMIVSAGQNTLVVPLTAIVETLKPKPGDVRSFGSNGALIRVRDVFLPVIDVPRELGYRDEPTDPMQGVVVLVECENGSHAGLLFDAIQGQRQVVIKSLETNYGRVPGVAAATILGDGRVALILDVDILTSLARADMGGAKSFMQAAE